MAVSLEIRTEIIGLSVAMLGAAPGVNLLAEYIAAVEGGLSLEELAERIAASDAFRETYPAFQTDAEFADAFLDNVFGGEVSPALHVAAVEIVVGFIDGGMTRAQVGLAVVRALFDIGEQGADHPAYTDFSGAIGRFLNQVEVAEYYSIRHRAAEPSTEVLIGVSSDPATVSSAIDAIENPPPPVPVGETYELTPGFDRITGTDANDTFIAPENTFTALDTLDGGAGDDLLEISSTGNLVFLASIQVRNIESATVSAEGSVTGDLSRWVGLDTLHLQNVGNEITAGPDGELTNSNRHPRAEDDNVTLALDIDMGGAGLVADYLEGMVNVTNAGTVELNDVEAESEVHIASADSTTDVHVSGGVYIRVGRTIVDSDNFIAESETIETVSLANADPENVHEIHSSVLSSLVLSEFYGTARIFNSSESNGDLAVTVDGFGGQIAEDVARSGIVDLRNTHYENITVTAAGDSSFRFDSGIIRTLTIDGTAALKLDVTEERGLVSIDGSGGSGDFDLTARGSDTLVSIVTGSGTDRVDVQGAHNFEGFSVDLGAGDDTYVAGERHYANGLTVIDGGAGTDVLMVANGAESTYRSGDDSIFSNFEVLDFSGGYGDYDMELLHDAGIRAIQATGGTGGRVNLRNLQAGFDVTLAGSGGEARARDFEIEYELADSSGNNDSVTFNFVAMGGEADDPRNSVASDREPVTGEVGATIHLNGIEELVIDSSAVLHAENGGKAETGDYTNLLVLVSPDLEELIVNGNVGLEIIGDVPSSVDLIDATENSGGVKADFSIAGSELTFRGSAGVDEVEGGAFDDTIIGGAGADRLTGGRGEDVFGYVSAGDSQVTFAIGSFEASGFDVVTDFDIDDDAIGLRFANLRRGDLGSILEKPVMRTDHDGDGNNGNDLRNYIGNGWRFFERGADDYRIAFVEHSGEGTYVFVDVNDNGDFDRSGDLVIFLQGVTDDLTSINFDLV